MPSTTIGGSFQLEFVTVNVQSFVGDMATKSGSGTLGVELIVGIDCSVGGIVTALGVVVTCFIVK